MSHTIESMTEPPLPQQGVTRRRVHPTNPFTPIAIHEVEQSVPQRFEAQVSRYPDRLAVKTREHAWTYARLNQEANRLAHAILAQCGGGEEPIAHPARTRSASHCRHLRRVEGGQVLRATRPDVPPRAAHDHAGGFAVEPAGHRQRPGGFWRKNSPTAVAGS